MPLDFVAGLLHSPAVASYWWLVVSSVEANVVGDYPINYS